MSEANLFERLVIYLFGRKCPECGSRDTEYSSYIWTRGWNNYCSQAYGDAGLRCSNCLTVTWDTSLEEHRKTLPTWCRDYGR